MLWTCAAVCGLAASVIYLVNASSREAIEEALVNPAPPRSEVGFFTVCKLGDARDWTKYSLIAPERAWCYGPTYLTAFRARAAEARTTFGDFALQRYLRPVLMWNDVAFAILTGLFSMLVDLGMSSAVQQTTAQLVLAILAVSGLAYGIVDVMEDVALIRILRTTSKISARQATVARTLTRLKMLTLTVSLSGLVLFLALGFIRSVYRRVTG